MVDSGTAVSPQPGQTRWSSPTETCIARRDPKDRLHRTAEGNSHNTEPWLTWFARLSAQPSALHHICYGRRSPQVARDMWSKCPGFWPGLRTCRSNSNVIWPKLVLMMMMIMIMIVTIIYCDGDEVDCVWLLSWLLFRLVDRRNLLVILGYIGRTWISQEVPQQPLGSGFIYS